MVFIKHTEGFPQTTFATELVSVLDLTRQRAILKNTNTHANSLGQLLYDAQSDTFVLVVEATMALYYQIKNSTTRTGVAVALCSYYHTIAGRSVIGSVARVFDTLADELAESLPFFQVDFGWIDVMDGLYNNTKRVVKSALGDKIAKVFNHVIAHSLYAKMGFDFDEGLFATLEKKVIRPTIWNALSFLDAVVGLILFLCKAGRQALLSGNIDCFFIDDAVLTNWIDEASELRKNSEFMNNPGALGMALPEYVHKLKTCIASGRKLLPFFKKGREHTILYNSVLELESVLKRHECAMLSASFRRAPVCVFLYGTAGVAKSFIATGLFNHYCSVRNISAEKATMWTRTENDDYYSGYKSHFAGVLYDDAAKYRKNVIQGVDPSIGDIISACNNIPFVTPQADLPDKGKIPFLSEWVGVTSNVEDLAANLYFNSSAAFLRRFAVRITPVVKEEYRVPGEDKIDASYLPEGVQYPDLWVFHVHVSRVNGMKGEFVHHATYEHYADLLEFMTGVYERHIRQQDRLMTTVGQIGPEKLCDCRLPLSLCACAQPREEILADDPRAVVQMKHDGCNKMHWKRVNCLMNQKRDLTIQHKDPIIRAWINQLYDAQDVSQWFDASYCDERDESVVLFELTDYFDKAVEEFVALDARDRLNMLSDGKFNLTQDSDSDTEYLSFQPKLGPPGFFLEAQMQWLREQILTFCKTLNTKELALLDVYLYEHAPRHIASGWGVGDVIRGGYDYIKYYSQAIEDPDRRDVREFLMDTRKPVWYERLGIKFAVAYFENQYFHKVVNVFIGLPGFTPFLGWCLRKATAEEPRAVLSRAGREYDYKLGGNNQMVRVFIAVAGAATLLVGVYKFATWMDDKRKSKPRVGCDRPVCMATAGECPPLGDSVNWHHSDSESIISAPVAYEEQMDLFAVGKKPVVREAEKKNVWHTPERNITKFDVDIKRPHNEDQACNQLRNNACYAEVRGEFPAGKGTGKTRVLIVDSETIVLNNHAIPAGGVITIWLNKATDTGVQPSFVVTTSEEMVRRFPDRDLAIIKTWSMPHAFRDIRHLFCKASYQSVGPATYVLREKSGGITRKVVVGVHQRRLYGMDGAKGVGCQAWASTPMEPTEVGQCGMPLVVNSPLGSVIVGIHAGYHAITNTAWAVRVNAEDLELGLHPTLGSIEPAYPIAQVKVELLRDTDKLYTDYHESGHIMTHGALRTFVARPKFTGRTTPHAEYIFSRGHEFNPRIEDNMAAPQAAGWKQPQSVLSTYLHPTHSMDEMVMRACTQAYCEHIDENFTQDDWDDIHPVPLSVAVNGFPGVPNVDAQKYTTSAGHGRRGPKLQFLSEPEKFEEWEAYREYDESIAAEINEMRENAYVGVRPHAIYDACFKDELLSKAKVEAGKARAIYMCPLAFLTNVRMSTLALCRVMIRRRDVFGCAIGLNTHSEEWDDIFQICEELDGDNWAAGDFKNFESVLNLLISNCVSKVFQHLAVRSGNYDDKELMALRVWLADISNATINFFGELITLLGGEASGQQMTTPFNCVANNLLHMYAYVCIYRGPNDRFEEYLRIARSFFVHVRRNTLGDDVYLKISPSKPEYNHTSIMKVFEAIGITYTMADKGAESRPYISHTEVTFLKRSFVDHSAFPGLKLAALDKKSVYKMLCYTVPSRSVSLEEQMAAAMACAQAEAFFHDREFFDQIASLIRDIPKSPELESRMKAFPLPSWNLMCQRFVDASPKLKARMLVPGDFSETTETKDSYCHASDLELQMEWSVDPWGSTTMERSSEDRFYGRVRLSSKKIPKAGAREITPELENNDFSKNLRKTTKNPPTPHDREMAPVVVEQAINKLTHKQRRAKRRQMWNQLVLQADIDYDTVSIPTGSSALNTNTDVAQENTVFKNEPLGEHLTIGDDNDALVSSMRLPQDLKTYLHRPKLIYSYSWAENGANGIKASFTPWSLYFTSTDMLNKLNGYGLLRSKLHLKFLINGSPFYYGSMMAAYTPLVGHRTDTAIGIGVPTTLVANSQKPHVWLENQNCSSAEMVLPFLYPYPYVPLGRASDIANMGTVTLLQYAPLLSANGTGSSTVDIQVYAWAEDTVLSAPTNRPLAQSEFVPDKQISKTASAVHAAAGALSKIPVIGAYAKATEMAAGTLAGAASYFGFTNVPNVSDVQPFKQMPFQLASTEISEPVAKLSLQAKQETSIGASQHGGTKSDDLTIRSFAGRSSFIVGTQWNTTAAPGEILFTTAVSPQMFNSVGTQVAHTPMSWIANHFQYWRGAIKYTFKVVRSPYHRGRIQVSWDALADSFANGPTIGNPNTLTTVMDLDEDSECSFVVPYMRHELFQQCFDIAGTGTALWSTDAVPVGSWPGTNGILNVRVLNRLTAPEASSSATILVFANTVDDFEFAAPKDYDTWTGNSLLQLRASDSAVVQSDVQYDDEQEAHELTPSGVNGAVYQQVFGERITSLREYLHRSSLSFMFGSMGENINTTAATYQFTLPVKRLPPPTGVYNNGWNVGTTTAGANQRVFYTKFHPMVSIGSCFVGYKGSVNVTVNVDQPFEGKALDTLSVLRSPYAENYSAFGRQPTRQLLGSISSNANVNAKSDIVNVLSGVSGAALTNTKTNAGMAAQLPYYSNAAFSVMDMSKEYNNQDTLTDTNNDWWRIVWRYNKAAGADKFTGTLTSTYYATGPDFDYVFFINVPIMTAVTITTV